MKQTHIVKRHLPEARKKEIFDRYYTSDITLKELAYEVGVEYSTIVNVKRTHDQKHGYRVKVSRDKSLKLKGNEANEMMVRYENGENYKYLAKEYKISTNLFYKYKKIYQEKQMPDYLKENERLREENVRLKVLLADKMLNLNQNK